MNLFKEQLSILYKMRFLENEGDDIEVFEGILNDLSHRGTNDIIPDLCTVFEDDIAEHKGLEEGLYKLAIGISKMLPQAEFWAERIHRTLLNSNDLVIAYSEALKDASSSTKQIIKEILLTIKEEDPDLYLEKVDMVLAKID
ncbi:hypothetical protein [Priestia endophytica]|jgi:hypothetical protein|uniref:hypothetical protein n=1 Tax=Priestia endophytica TaxID=135735 RepID=UPI000DCA5370|nr:hypothetical protein [Priestia endophytica]RAS80691.1 hypothetical protein A4R27_13110 [Priestia endophytica]